MRILKARLRPDGDELRVGEIDLECTSEEQRSLQAMTDRYHPDLDVFAIKNGAKDILTVCIQCPSQKAKGVTALLHSRLNGES